LAAEAPVRPQAPVLRRSFRESLHQEKRADDTLLALLAGGAGGAGGWTLGKKVLEPYFAGKERAVAEELASQQRRLARWNSLRKGAPTGGAIGGAVIGALLLAALAAAKTKKREQEKQYLQQLRMYDPTGGGFASYNQVPFGTTDPGDFYG